MRIVLAYLRASWLSASSYKFSLLTSLAGTLAGIIPLYFVSGALQPLMQGAIRDEGGQYFAFLLVGISAFYLIGPALDAIPSALSNAISTGTLESIFTTPAPLPMVIAGMTSYSFTFILVRIACMIGTGALLGAQVYWAHMPIGMFLIVLIAASYLPIALLIAALILTFRTAGPLPGAIQGLSALLGGVYYPTHVIPSWLEQVSRFVPLTYGLRALRRVMLDGATLWSVRTDVLMVVASTALLGAVGVLAFDLALRRARRVGTLGLA